MQQNNLYFQHILSCYIRLLLNFIHPQISKNKLQNNIYVGNLNLNIGKRVSDSFAA